MISNQIKKDLGKVLGKLKISPKKLVLEHPTNSEHGDYSTNIAMQVKKKDFPAPFDLAAKIVNTWRSLGLPEYLAKIEVAKPGFINLWLHQDFFISQVYEVLKKKDKFGSLQVGKGKTVVIDYSSPNIARPFGIGHFRSTVIGQAIANIYKFLGWQVVSINHLGDWGTQFGKLIYQIELKIKNGKFKIKELTIKDLEKLYVDFHKKAAKNPKLDDEARTWFKKLEEGDSQAKMIWRACVDVSLKEFNRIYKMLGVKFDYILGESFYQNKMAAVIEKAKRKKVAEMSDGALVIKFPELNIPPAILVKNDGATTYEARDLAAIAYRHKRWKPDLFVYEVGAEQKLHFQQTFSAAVKLGYGKPEQFVHLGHGLIRLLKGGKLSTRTGKTIWLEEILNEAIKRAQKLGCKNQKTAQMVGIGAVKYFDLMHHLTTDIIFDWEKIFVLEGNSGPYLQYTYARCQSVLRKASQRNTSEEKHLGWWRGNNLDSSEMNVEEIALLRTIYKFPEVVQEAGEKFSPNLICNFLFDLAQKYNLFYNRLPILKADNENLRNFRLALTIAVGQILKNGLNLLGIETPERM